MILILDFGSQYTQLIARRLREAHVYSEIHPYSVSPERIRKMGPRGIILSGGPASAYRREAPDISREVLELGCPVLGICYGLYILAHHYGGVSAESNRREYGRAVLMVDEPDGLFANLGNLPRTVWMSHGDRLDVLPVGFRRVAHTEDSPYAAIRSEDGRLWGLQFHPEVSHTEGGFQLLRNFAVEICGASADWRMADFAATQIAEISQRVGPKDRVLMALSGGVDSSVAAALIERAIGSRLKCIFVDTGLLRAGDRERVAEIFGTRLASELRIVDAAKEFLGRLRGETDPERKRRIIGHTFVEVFEREASTIGGVRFLGQGTLYPDVIESVSTGGPSRTIKSHHNVGGLPERMRLELIEPLRQLFKDEVRELGRELGLPEEVVGAEPFPGPGLAVRILGEVTPDRVALLRKADQIVREEIAAAGLSRRLWQAFAVLLPLNTVGVMGDGRTYENVIAIRAVESLDGMTADWARLDSELLDRIARRITSQVRGVNRVVYDVTSKPPATIEWE